MPDETIQLHPPTPMLRPDVEAGSSVPAIVMPYRAPLAALVERQLAACRRNGTTLVLLCIGLDGLEAVNRRHGETVGNQALFAVWNRLRSRLRSSDLAVHEGSTEFGAILLDAGPAAALASTRLADALREPYGIDALEIVLSVGTGAAVYPHSGSTGEALVAAARRVRALKAAAR